MFFLFPTLIACLSFSASAITGTMKIQKFKAKISNLARKAFPRKRNQSVKENEFPLSYLPDHLQLSILRKLDYDTFALFDECSRLTNSLAGRNTDFHYTKYEKSLVFDAGDGKEDTSIPEDAPVVFECNDVELCKLEVTFLEVKLTGTETEFPFDVHTLQRISCSNAVSLSTDTLLSVNSKRLYVSKCNLTPTAIARHILAWKRGTERYDKGFLTEHRSPIPITEILSRLDLLGVEYQKLKYKNEVYTEFYAIKREVKADPVLLLGCWRDNRCTLRSPRRGEDMEAVMELLRTANTTKTVENKKQRKIRFQ